MIPKINFLGLNFSNFTFLDLVRNLTETVNTKTKVIVYGYSLGTFPYMTQYPVIYSLGQCADIVVCDGRGLFLLMKSLKSPIKYEISLPNLVLLTLKLAERKKFSILLLGGSIENNLLATVNLRKDYPNAMIYDGIDGYFADEEIVLDKINHLKPDILLIGISSPKKEIFILQNRKKISSNIIIPCGGMIDVLAGKVKQTPAVFKYLGLASLFRVLQEPRRLARRYFFIYTFLFFKFLPVIFFKVVLLRNKKFSIPKFCGLGIIGYGGLKK